MTPSGASKRVEDVTSPPEWFDDPTAPLSYHLVLREITARHGALLVFDEVITGFRVALGVAAPEVARGN